MSFDPKLDLEIERLMRAAPENIWRCWAEPDLFKQWFTPPGVDVIDCEQVLEPGGRSYTVMRLPDGTEMPMDGCFLHVEPLRRFVYTDALAPGFRPKPDAGFMAVDVTLTPQAGGTLYRAVVRHGTQAQQQSHLEMGFTEGWGTTFAQLDALAAGL